MSPLPGQIEVGVGNVPVLHCCVINHPRMRWLFSLASESQWGSSGWLCSTSRSLELQSPGALSRLSRAGWPSSTSRPLAEKPRRRGLARTAGWPGSGLFLLHVVSPRDTLTCRISYMTAQGFPKWKVRSCQALFWLRLRTGTAAFPLVNRSERPSSDPIWEGRRRPWFIKGHLWTPATMGWGYPGGEEKIRFKSDLKLEVHIWGWTRLRCF